MTNDTALSVAERLWAAQIEEGLADEAASDALILAAALDRNIPEAWPFDDITFDNYDGSFEFKNVTPGWEPTADVLTAWWALGFFRCWICYMDETEKYFAAPGGPPR